MAALCACNEFVIVSNGRCVAALHFSNPEEIQLLDVPDVQTSGAQSQKTDNGVANKTPKAQNNGRDLGDGNTDTSSGDENLILTCGISPDGQWAAVCDDRKTLHLYKLADGRLHLTSSRGVPRRCTTVRFTSDNSVVVIADKAGDVYSFPVLLEEGVTQKGDADPGREGKKNNSPDEEVCEGGSLVLGHLSMLLDMILVTKDSRIITSDRDEKIRVSQYPDAYVIESFCLGHSKFVISLAFDEDSQSIISGSGDSTVKLWSLSGQELFSVNVLDKLPDGGATPASGQTGEEDVTGTLANRLACENAVQRLTYCSKCKLLFVAIYRSEHIPVYRLKLDQGLTSLEFLTVLSCSHKVSSISVSRCVLWVLAEGGGDLMLSAYRIQGDGDTVKLTDVETDSRESKMIQVFSSQEALTKGPPSSMDLFPFLWKSAFQEDATAKRNIKRPTAKSGQDLELKKSKVDTSS
ncbi:tRNA (guanine-N(7)-)-methyltransferase non-catalytic subunit wdr4-like isoform X2 [Physella acuta]|uniref:tRNA (guanine-N(7)-)-methyltransferase non-catalytic subunit wdr4-like isoform X2 n=1 Tax=Physella acuta TaxID=109671 RepID=UPI0027DC818B|nr:tRNA (guanine-N(7)-)-methyltransferase non-catalytic subunit wdr4-like isoform X2 [Physella acuta]